MARERLVKRWKRSLAKKLYRFITSNYSEPLQPRDFLSTDEAATLFIEFDKRLASVEARLTSNLRA